MTSVSAVGARIRVAGAVTLPLSVSAGWTALITAVALARLGQRSLNIDEAGYLAIAASHYSALRMAGWEAWWASVLGPSQHAPLVPVLTSLVMATGLSFRAAGLLTIGLFYFVGLFSTWLLAERIRGKWAAWGAGALVATCPGLLIYGSQYTFIIPTFALLAASLLALLHSAHLTRTPWSILFGLLLGLLPLVRTMNFAFVAALGLAALLITISTPVKRVKWIHLGLAALLCLCVLTPWLSKSWRLVATYLTGYGYGAEASEYSSRTNQVLAVVQNTLYSTFFIHAVVLSVGSVLAVVIALWGIVRGRDAWSLGRLRSAIGSPLFPSIALCVGGFGALATTSNAGSGFGLQLISPLSIIAVCGWSLALRAVRQPILCLVSAFAVVAITMPALGVLTSLDVFDNGRSVRVPVVGEIWLTTGNDFDTSYLLAGNTGQRVNSPNWSDDWIEVSSDIAEIVLSHPGVDPSLGVAFRGLYTNVNTIQLEVLESGHHAIRVAQLEPQIIEPSLGEYSNWLVEGEASGICFIASVDSNTNEFSPVPNHSLMKEALVIEGFHQIETLRSPDERVVSLWQRSSPGCQG